MKLLDLAQIARYEYLVVKNSPNIPMLKLIFISLVYANCSIEIHAKKNLISIFFDYFNDVYQYKKNSIIDYFEMMQLLIDSDALKMTNDYKLFVNNDFVLSQDLSQHEIDVLRELEKISDNVFYGMVVGNV